MKAVVNVSFAHENLHVSSAVTILLAPFAGFQFRESFLTRYPDKYRAGGDSG